MNIWKEVILSILGCIGSLVAAAFGGWDAGMTTICAFMALDLFMGCLIAAYFKRSPKSPNGALSSKSYFQGVCKKMMILAFIFIGYRIDLVMNIDYLRNAIIIGCIANELISILENAGIMGVKLPKALTEAIDLLKHKEGK